MSSPLVSVIIPTYNRAQSLHRALESILQQNIPTSMFEVIVVDDGSTDETPDIAEESWSYSLKYYHQQNLGSAEARNTGARLASGRILVFLDDDMVAEPDYLGGLIEEHAAYSHIVGMGTEYPCLSEPASIYGRVVAAERERREHNSQTSGFVDFTACVTNNLSVERDDYYAIGAMQDVAGDGPTWWGDVDFGYRAFRKGMQFRRSAKAICLHCDYSLTDFETVLARAEKASYLVHYLIRKYPDIVNYLPMFDDKLPIDWRNDHIAMKFRKAIRLLTSTSLMVGELETAVRQLERYYPKPALLGLLYRWTIGGYIYRGYRHGLKEVSDHSAPATPAPARTSE